MRLSLSCLSCAAAAAVIGSSLLVGGCASKETFPASPVPVILSDMQAARVADIYLAQKHGFEVRQPASMQPTGDGYLLAYRTAFDADDKPPRQSHLLLVQHDGDVREITFTKGE